MKTVRLLFAALGLLLLSFSFMPSFAQTRGSFEVKVSLLDKLDTSQTKSGQTFSAMVDEPVMDGKKVILPRGTAVQGRVTDVVSSGRLKRPASITLTLTNIMGTRGAGGLQTQALQIDGKSHGVRNVALIGGGAAAGAVLGGVADGGKGALIGTAVGASAGTATAFLTGKQELVLPVETELTFVVASESVAPPKPYYSPGPVTSDAHGVRGDARHDDQDAFDALIFSPRDQAMIRSYYRGAGGRGLPPGLAKRNGNLPPGLEKQVRANGTLPPGLQKRVEPFPADLDRQLPRVPVGYSRVMMDGRAMTVGSDNRIIDVFVVF